MGNINLFIVFVEGLLSIFSPCILPILPIYLSMLANSSVDEIKGTNFRKHVLFKNTLFFTLGISTTFFILGSTIHVLSSFFNQYRSMIMLVGGIFIILMGLFYLGVIKIDVLNREKKLNVEAKATMSSLSSFILGFTFSFGWTPCIGPILASVLVMASSSENVITSNLMILVYTVGFILPFLIASLFYNKLFKKFDKMKQYMKAIKGISGAFIIIAGVVMLVNGVMDMNRVSNIKPNTNSSTSSTENDSNSSANNDSSSNAMDRDQIKPIDFTLYDQYGNEHTLSEYKGKTVFLNFWATWCPPCRAEMPHMEELYQEYKESGEDIVILGVASPNLGREGSEEQITKFLEEEGHTFPVVFDKDGAMVYQYGINAFPSTFIINKEGYITKYIPGAMDKKTMKNLIESEHNK